MTDPAQGGQEKPKIIIDEDWKSKVQAEKEQAEQARARQTAGDSPIDSPASSAGESEGAQAVPPDDQAKRPPQLPPASFSVLVQSLATQAVAALGQLPGPDGKPLDPQPELARHFIDSLGVLEEKTRGNLTPQEQEMLSGVLHELRMLCVNFSGRQSPPPAAP